MIGDVSVNLWETDETTMNIDDKSIVGVTEQVMVSEGTLAHWVKVCEQYAEVQGEMYDAFYAARKVRRENQS